VAQSKVVRLGRGLPAAGGQRSTARLTEAHWDLGVALGGEGGSRLAGALDRPTSPDTLLRRVKDWLGPAVRRFGSCLEGEGVRARRDLNLHVRSHTGVSLRIRHRFGFDQRDPKTVQAGEAIELVEDLLE
jgi:hypothetical protein